MAAVNWNKLDKSPMRAKLFCRKHNTTRWHILTANEDKRLLAAADSELRALLAFALHTGLRRSQVANLMCQDVDLVEEKMTMSAEINKSNKEHTLPLNPVAMAVLKSLPRTSEYCLRDEIYPMRAWGFEQALKKAGLPRSIRFHELRHASITPLAESGAPIDHVRILAQHSNRNVTLRYVHSDEDRLREAARAVCQPGTHGHKLGAEGFVLDENVMLMPHKNSVRSPRQAPTKEDPAVSSALPFRGQGNRP